MSALLTITSKVLVILLLILVGYVLAKKRVVTEKGTNEITSILIKVVTPCLIINSLIDSRGSIEIKEMLLAAALPAISIVICIGMSHIFFRKENDMRKPVLQFSIIFGNFGFMGIPLVQGIVGDQGVVYGSFAVVMFNVFCWTYGYRLMNSGAKMTLRTILLNPGIIGILIGLPLYFINIPVPSIIKEPLEMLSSLNTPLAMVVIGSFIARVDIKSFVSDISVYKMSAIRLLLAPAIFMGVLLLIRPSEELFMTSIIQAATPVAANSVLFAVTYKKDSQLASKSVAVSTVLSILTIPIFTVIAQMLVGMLY